VLKRYKENASKLTKSVNWSEQRAELSTVLCFSSCLKMKIQAVVILVVVMMFSTLVSESESFHPAGRKDFGEKVWKPLLINSYLPSKPK